MEFPTILYRKPGPFPGPGMTYNTIGANDVEQAEKLMAEGWKATFAELLEAKAVELVTPATQEPADEDAPPTREEIEAKAVELGIKFDKKMSDEKIIEKIAEALQAKG
jgi:hypothetical protein